ncbi:MAG: BlaI/MecI/CopY family transcriptional regulator [Oscillospiraceae bacterium]
MNTIKKLPDSELEAMIAIWESDEAISGARIAEILQTRKGWSQSTVFTLLVRLADKGYISCVKQGKSNFYAPLIAEDEYRISESQTVLDRFYAGSLKNFLAGFCGSKTLSTEDLAALRRFVDEKSAEDDKSEL